VKITITRRRAATAVCAIALAAGVAACGTQAAAPSQSPAAAAKPAPAKTVTAPPRPQPTKTVTAPPASQAPVIINNNPPAQAPAAQAPAPAYGEPDPASVVYQYYADIDDGDFTDAWALGGSNIAARNGQTYDEWVAGYSGSEPQVSATDEGDGVVSVTVTGGGQAYAGSYTVSEGVIVSGSLTQTS